MKVSIWHFKFTDILWKSVLCYRAISCQRNKKVGLIHVCLFVCLSESAAKVTGLCLAILYQVTRVTQGNLIHISDILITARTSQGFLLPLPSFHARCCCTWSPSLSLGKSVSEVGLLAPLFLPFLTGVQCTGLLRSSAWPCPPSFTSCLGKGRGLT